MRASLTQRFFASLLTIFWAAAPAFSEELPPSLDANDLEALTKLAGDGSQVAQHRLCYIYSYGKGVPKDAEKALLWCEIAAHSGGASAMTLYAEKFYLAQGTPEDMERAFIWYEKAARLGHPHAQYMVGTLYWRGFGVEKDQAAALKWLRLAAAQEHPPAIKLLQEIDPWPEFPESKEQE